MEGGGPTLSRRNSVRSAGGSRRGSAVIEVDVIQDQASIFGTKKPLKKSKPVSSVKINFMGKPMVYVVCSIRAVQNNSGMSDEALLLRSFWGM